MLNVVGFSWGKTLVIISVQILFSAISTVALHLLFGIEIGSTVSYVSAVTCCSIGGVGLLFYIRGQYRQHTLVVRHLLDAISAVIIVKDYNGNFVYCNQAVAELYDTTPEEMLGKDDYYFTKNKEQADFFKNNTQEIIDKFAKEEVYESSTDIKTGEIRHFQSVKIPYYDSLGQLKIVIFAKDITEIINLREEAELNKARLELILDVSEEGLWEWNAKTNQVLHNRQWESITGISRSENTFKEFENCILPEDRAKVLNAIELLVQNNQPYNIEFRMKRPDGKTIWVWDRGQAAEYDKNKEPLWLVGILQDITAQKKNQQKIVQLAYHDQLTGLANRSQLENDLRKVVDISNEKNVYSATLFLDLDRFKLLNDSYGHHMGDKLLEAVAKRLKETKLEHETIARFGGDEFVIVLPLLDVNQDAALKKAEQKADLIVQTISKAFTLISDFQNVTIDYSITASVGGIVFRSEGLSPEKLIQLADTALYRTKASGGHSALIYDVSMHDELRQTSELQKAMLDSIANRDFCIYLQPKFNAREEMVGAEALVRWNHPELGLLLPAAFIDIAEETNMILPIEAMILEQVCSQLLEWQSSPETKHLEIAINISAKSIWRTTFVDDFIYIVESYGIDHTRLIAEVTESLLIQDIRDATSKLTQLREYGISISLDDFGTGYSSLNYLRSLPIDEIKVDRSFIKDVIQDKQALLMVKSIIELAKNFDIRLVSEGVEEKEQLDLLKELGVNVFQGFYFSEPLSTEDIKSHFKNVKAAI